ncbi:MAG: GNAT family N-acetyltransferase [Gillisia sp.]
MSITLNIRRIPAAETYAVRQPVLRPGRPLSECIFEGDLSPETFHLGYFRDEDLTGVASFMKKENPVFFQPFQYQLRGMAVLPDFKGKGIGAALLKAGEAELRKLDASVLLWFNARNYAVGFYEKFGYKTIGIEFDVPGVCPHIVMFQQLYVEEKMDYEPFIPHK